MSIEFCGAYSEQETSALKDFLQQRLVKYQYTQAATVANFATICFDIPQEFGRLYPQSVEQVLRALSSGVYLAAMPMNGDIINLQTTWSRLPQLESGQELPFFLPLAAIRAVMILPGKLFG